ncbi:thermonuclease family protein [Fimbriiglobus ruber]|uniref:Putative nuclease n=1 Tax=Fimbriiglobus ruber TaxID=1908690 RepID=A0A225D221_9BACT|nr:thermonuclease family protein [Fimbriiglobus ruber]OWK34983.1 putative nuclease [Fimbriiglobus ruber]
MADGDTITVLDADKKQHKIRLNGIEAPEKAQPFGTKSKAAMGEKVAGKDVVVIWSKRDRYGWILGDVTVEGLALQAVQQVEDTGGRGEGSPRFSSRAVCG